MRCRFCNHTLGTPYLDLDSSPLSNALLTSDGLLSPETYLPLQVYVCEQCWLAQIGENPDAETIFNQDYLYYSSYSETWLEHCRKHAMSSVSRFNLDNQSLVIEAASNDGYLLQYFKSNGIPVLGIEPSAGTASKALEKGIETRVEFFGLRLAESLKKQGALADMFVANNVLAHVPDINDFVAGIKLILKQSGIGSIEFPHLTALHERMQFDTVYHEHYSYFTLNSVNQIMSAHGLRIFDVDILETHGGSLRVYVCNENSEDHKNSNSVADLLKTEQEKGVQTNGWYADFQHKVDLLRFKIIDFLVARQTAGSTVAGYGAAAKGNTLLNYCGITKGLLPYVVDISPHKQGKFLPGTRIPVLDVDEIKRQKPDYLVVLPHNLLSEVMEQHKYIAGWGGSFVRFVPDVEVFDA